MEVVLPMNEFHFESTLSSPYLSAPSSPRQFKDPFDYYHHYTSAPTSPRCVAQVLTSSLVPFDWEERPGTPKSTKSHDMNIVDDYGDDFAFDFSRQLEKGRQPPDLTAADELFEEGMIRPLKLPPRLYNTSFDDKTNYSVTSSPRSPKSPHTKTLWSPRKKDGVQFDPFTAAMVEATRERGRERGQPSTSSISSSRSRKASRSLSPMRGGVGGFFRKESSNSKTTTAAAAAATVVVENMKSSSGSRKWRLRDLLLFRSASEGRATGNRSKDPLNKYTVLSSSSILPTKGNTKRREDSDNSSFRSTESNGSTRKGRGPTVSAHEKHYVSNRATSGELKKKTPLPYRQGLFGCLRFNPAVNGIARGFHNSYSFGRRQY